MSDKFVVVAVTCGEVGAARAFVSLLAADAWGDGFAAGANAFGGDECSVFVFPRDEAEFEQHSSYSDYMRSEVAKARASARPWSRDG